MVAGQCRTEAAPQPSPPPPAPPDLANVGGFHQVDVVQRLVALHHAGQVKHCDGVLAATIRKGSMPVAVPEQELRRRHRGGGLALPTPLTLAQRRPARLAACVHAGRQVVE